MVDAKVLAARPVTNVAQALQGTVPGLNFTVGSEGGALDGSMSFNIRGAGTIGDGSGSPPLVLIDGIEGNLNSLNRMIETVSVLKDAASASIYGARAAFGVILIQTKKGKAGKARVSYNGNVRFSDAVSVPEMMDSYTLHSTLIVPQRMRADPVRSALIRAVTENKRLSGGKDNIRHNTEYE